MVLAADSLMTVSLILGGSVKLGNVRRSATFIIPDLQAEPQQEALQNFPPNQGDLPICSYREIRRRQ